MSILSIPDLVKPTLCSGVFLLLNHSVFIQLCLREEPRENWKQLARAPFLHKAYLLGGYRLRACS